MRMVLVYIGAMDSDARAAAAAMWDGADYDGLATLPSPAAERVAARAAEAAPGRALDLAAGTGSVALRLAGAGRPVDALDLAPGLVDIGRRRSTEAGLDVTWRVGSFDELHRSGDGYAVVTSSFGLIFAADPVAALTGVTRVLRQDGALVIAVWDPSGYIASMSRAMAELLPEPGRAAATAWIRWGESACLNDWCGRAGLSTPTRDEHRLPWRFPSATAATDFLFAKSPGHAAAARAMGADRPRLERTVLDHLVDFAGLDSPARSVDIEATYLIATARPLRPVSPAGP